MVCLIVDSWIEERWTGKDMNGLPLLALPQPPSPLFSLLVRQGGEEED